MSISRTVHFVPKILPAGRLSGAIRAAIQSTGRTHSGTDVSRRLPDDSTDAHSDVPLTDLDTICDLGEEELSIKTSAGDGSNWHYLALYGGGPGTAYGGGPGTARMHVRTSTAGVGEAMVDAFFATAGLERFIDPESIEESREAVETPSVRAEPSPDRLRAFLSYRFGSPANEAAAAAIGRLLELVNVEVVTGRSYEPRPLNEKVSGRLVGIDILILFVGIDGQSAWTRDEIGAARAMGIPVVPLVTERSEFEPGIFGDQEYVVVPPDHVGDGFVSLLEAIAYVRRRH